MIKGTIPVNVRTTLDTLKTIEHMDVHVPRKTKKSVEKSGDRKRKGYPKDKGLLCKWKKSSKYCALCAKHSGAETAHNTGDYKKYEKDGTFKKAFKSSKGKSAEKKIDLQSFKKMEEDLKKVRTELKKFRKGSRKSKKH